MTSIVELGTRHRSDKGTVHSYLEVYDVLFAPWREQPVQLLEIGVDQGESLRLWCDVFPQGYVHGIDIDPRGPAGRWGNMSNPRCDARLIDATEEDSIDKLFADNSLDIIIDDGSHRIKDQLLAYVWLWPKLKVGGLYVIEDVAFSNTPRLDAHGFTINDRRHLKGQGDDILAIKERR